MLECWHPTIKNKKTLKYIAVSLGQNIFRQDQYDSASKFDVTSVTTDLNGSVLMSFSIGFIKSFEAEKLSSKKMICFTYNS